MGASKKNRKATAAASAIKPVKDTTVPADVSYEYKLLIAAWITSLAVTAALFAVAFKWLRPNLTLGEGKPSLMLIILGVLAIGEFVASIWLWRNVMMEAERKKNLWLAQKGYFTAWLLCMAAIPLGYVIAKSDDGRFYYGFFILAALGILYHQPDKVLLREAAPRVKPAAAPEPKPEAAPEPKAETAPEPKPETASDSKPETTPPAEPTEDRASAHFSTID